MYGFHFFPQKDSYKNIDIIIEEYIGDTETEKQDIIILDIYLKNGNNKIFQYSFARYKEKKISHIYTNCTNICSYHDVALREI